jgi:hypothetical protein
LSVPRPDLLALSPDDLAALANRGLVKRAQRECEVGELMTQWEVSGDGTICATWSDGVVCTLPGGGTVKDAQCSCGALGLCRHVLRTVLAWQQREVAAVSADETRPSGPQPWDPGRIDDVALERQVARTVLNRAASMWSQGVLAELLRSAKPSAHFHCPGHTVRFPVPDDLRYAQCSCAEPAPCVHAVLAVRAFRLLDAGASSGIVSAGPLDSPAPLEVLEAAESCMRDLLTDGLASLGPPWRDRLRRVASECASASLMWPAQILEEMSEDFDRYIARNAAFTPGETAERVGELLLRLDAIRAGCAPVPQAFIRGMTTDRDSDLGPARFIGLGAAVTETRRSSRLTVFLQSCDNGHVMTVVRDVVENADSIAERKPFHELARAPAAKGASLAVLAAGQLVTQGGRRTTSGRLVIGRARAVVNPQNYMWEQLKAPALVEDFDELSVRLRLLPPASFRPRREAADFHVCSLEGVEHAAFDPTSNAIVALLRDRSGLQAELWHPWTTRGEPGAEALLAGLTSGAKPLFVAGLVRASGAGLVIRPTAVVFAGEGDARSMVMPWLGALPTAATRSERLTGPSRSVRNAYGPATELAAELVLNGRRRTAARGWPGWPRAITETEECGYHQMAAAMRRVQAADQGMNAALGMLKLLALARDTAQRFTGPQ